MGINIRKVCLTFAALVLALSDVVIAQEGAPARKPVSQEMEQVAGRLGTWEVEFESRDTPDEPFTKLHTTSVITPILSGRFHQESLILPTPSGKNFELIGILGFDRYRTVYRFAWLDDTYALFDVFEGNWQDGKLVVDNLRARTSMVAGGKEYFGRMLWGPIGPDGFTVESQVSTDGGATWFTQTRGRYFHPD